MSETLGPVEVEFVIPPDFGRDADAAIKKMAGMTDAARATGANMADAFKGAASQTAESIKAAITSQKQLIKEIEQDIKNLQKQLPGSTGQDKLNILGDIKGAKKALAEEQGTLVGMQKQRVEANSKEVESQGSLIGSLSKWAIGLFTVNAALKLGKSMIESTETTTHQFERGVAGASAGLDYFFKSIASGDWSNFFEGMGKAVKGAKEFVDAMEDIENKRNEQKGKSSKLDIEIGKNRQDSYSTDNKVVKQALKNIIQLQTEKLTEEAKLDQETYEVKLKKIASDNNLTELEVRTIATNYSKVSASIKTGEKYLAAANSQRLTSRVDLGLMLDAHKIVTEMGQAGADAAAIAERLGKVPMADRTELANLYAKANESKAAIDINNRRDKQRLVNIEKQEQKQAADDAKKAAEDRNKITKSQLDFETEIGRQRIQNQLDIDQQTLNLQRDGAEKSRQQANLDFQKAIVDIATKKAEQLKKLNEVNGGISKETGKQTATYVSNLPVEDQKQIDDKILLAEKTRANKIAEINEKEGVKLKEIWRDINDTRLTGLEKQRAQINEKYDQMARDAKGHADLLLAIEHERVKATTAFNIHAAVDEAKFEEQVASQKAELGTTGVDREDRLLEKLYQIHRMYQQLIIDRLKASPDIKDQQQAIVLQNDLDIGDKNHTLDTKLKKWKEILGITNLLIDGVRQYNSGLADSLDLAVGLGKTLIDMKAGGSGLEGFSSITNIVFKAADMLDKQFGDQHKIAVEEQKRVEYNKQIAAELDIIQYSLERQLKLIDSMNLTPDIKISKTIEAYKEEIQKAKDDLSRMQFDMFTAGTDTGWDTTIKGLQLMTKTDDAMLALKNALGRGLISQEQYDLAVQYLNTIKDGLDNINEQERQNKELLTQTNAEELSNQLADALVNAYASGEDAAIAWGKVTDQVLAKAVINAMKLQFISGPVSKAIDALYADMTADRNGDGLPDNMFSSDGLATFKDNLQKIFDAANPAFSVIESMFPDLYGPGANSTSSSVKNSFSSMNQETGSALLGQFTALRMSSAAVADILSQEKVARNIMMKSVTDIADNTHRMADKLDVVSGQLASIETDGIKIRG